MNSKHWRCALCGWLNVPTGARCVSCDKSRPRKKKSLPLPVFRAWRCVVLALDTASKTGWSVWSCGRLIAHGEFTLWSADGVRECIRVVDIARDAALAQGIPWVVMSERSWGGHMGTGATEALGFWKFQLLNAQLPIVRIGQVYPARWRARVLPKGMHSAKREAVRKEELKAARMIALRVDIGDDEAPAILIGKWATKSGEVGEMLPKNAREFAT